MAASHDSKPRGLWHMLSKPFPLLGNESSTCLEGIVPVKYERDVLYMVIIINTEINLQKLIELTMTNHPFSYSSCFPPLPHCSVIS